MRVISGAARMGQADDRLDSVPEPIVVSTAKSLLACLVEKCGVMR